MSEDLIERLNEAWRKLYGDGDEHGVCDTLAEAAAALEAARGDGWQPIETAPKDGSEFLSVANYTDEPRQVQIVDWDFVQQCQPGLYTHWMPLPEPPEVGQDEGGGFWPEVPKNGGPDWTGFDG